MGRIKSNTVCNHDYDFVNNLFHSHETLGSGTNSLAINHFFLKSNKTFVTINHSILKTTNMSQEPLILPDIKLPSEATISKILKDCGLDYFNTNANFSKKYANSVVNIMNIGHVVRKDIMDRANFLSTNQKIVLSLNCDLLIDCLIEASTLILKEL